MNTHPRIAFFGTPEIAVRVLEEMERAGFLPTLVVTAPDKPAGRKMVLTPPPVKVWATEKSIQVLQPTNLTDQDTLSRLRQSEPNLFVVAAYGNIIPKEILDMPKHGVLNVHPSLLPKFRGASPIRSAILADERETGVTIMQLDEKMDHGPIVAQEKVAIPENEWPIRGSELDELLARRGGKLLAEVIPKWISGEVTATPQDHDAATFCSKITKADGELKLSEDPYQNFLKIQAFDGWPGTFFFDEYGKRIKITKASYKDGQLHIEKVIPEGKKEVSFDDYRQNN